MRNEISADNIVLSYQRDLVFDRESSRMKVRILELHPIREREVAGRLEEQPMFGFIIPVKRGIG